MKRTSIKEEFGTELKFTKFLSENKEASQRFLEAAEIYSEDYEITPEEKTTDGKRPDLIVRDEEDKIIAVVEAQDANGWLDSNHASKIMYYMYDKECDLGILLVEDATEEIKGYIRHLNKNTSANIFVLLTLVYENKFVDFRACIRPFPGKTEIIKKSSSGKTTSTTSEYHPIKEIVEEIYEESKKEYKDVFTTHTSRYLGTQKLGNNNLAVSIHPRANGEHVVALWHRRKYENHADFEKAFTDFVKQELNMEVFSFAKHSAKIKTKGTKNSLKIHKIFVDAAKAGKFDFKPNK